MTTLRSFLFVPGDSEKKLAKVDTCGADAVILDLEDAVAPANKAVAREMVAEFLVARPKSKRTLDIWVRVNPLETGLTLDDLAAVMAGHPNGIMQPKANGPDDVRQLSHYLDAFEVSAGLPKGEIKILPLVTETAIAPFNLKDYATAKLNRLAGLTWGAEDLSAALGASTNRAADGSWAPVYEMVRSQVLLAAHAAGVPAIDTLYADYKDAEGLLRTSQTARAEGFTGRLAIHPAQVKAINDGFTPSEAEVAHAKKVIAAFDAAPNVGTVGIDGKMYDRPHLNAARKTIALSQI